MSCERMTRLASSPFTSTAAEVSSHDVSMPRTASATSAGGGGRRGPPQRPRVGERAGGEAEVRAPGGPMPGAGSAPAGGGGGRRAPPERHRGGNRGGGDAAGGDGSDPGCATIPSRDGRDDGQGIGGDRLDPLFGAADG